MDQSRIMALKKKSEQEEPSFLQRASRATDDFLQERVVDPLTQAGYPNLGAGIAAIPSAIVGAPAAREEANAKPDAIMAGDAPGLAAGKAFSPQETQVLLKKLADRFGDNTDAIAKNFQMLEKQQLARMAGKDLADPAMVQRDSRAVEQTKALFTKPAARDNVVYDASSVKQLPKAQESAKQYESAAEEWARTKSRK